MKHLFTCFFVGVWLISIPTLAQKTINKKETTNAEAALKRRNEEIRFQARNKITRDLSELLNIITHIDLGEAERNSVIQNSFLLNPNQVFSGDDVIIQDDIDPNHNSAKGAINVAVEKYLRDLDLFYAKSDSATITFSRIIVADVQEGAEYPYVKVFFTSTFNGRHNQIGTPYQPVDRVAELRAEKVDNKWRTFITRLAFVRPGEGPGPPSEPGPEPPIGGLEIIYQNTNNSVDSVSMKWNRQWLRITQSSTNVSSIGFYQRNGKSYINQDKGSLTFKKKDQQFTFRQVDGTTNTFKRTKEIFDPTKPPISREELSRRAVRNQRRGWFQIASGVLAIGVSYAGYAYLQSSYKAYQNQINNLNAEYAIWKSLSNQPGGIPKTLMAFSNYASPSIYAVYGGGAVGAGLVINGFRYLRKAKRLKSQARK